MFEVSRTRCRVRRAASSRVTRRCRQRRALFDMFYARFHAERNAARLYQRRAPHAR